jgi:hypothetical protein
MQVYAGPCGAVAVTGLGRKHQENAGKDVYDMIADNMNLKALAKRPGFASGKWESSQFQGAIGP